MTEVLASVRRHVSNGAFDQALDLFCHELDNCTSVVSHDVKSSSGSGIVRNRDVLVVRCLLAPIRAALCPHTTTINMKEYDVKFMLVLKNIVFKALPKAAWSRTSKRILISDLNDTTPFDGSTGLVDYITMKACCLIELISAGGSNISEIKRLLDVQDKVLDSVLVSPSLVYVVTEAPPGWTLMHLAAASKNTTNECLQLLLSYGLTLNNNENESMYTPLHVACCHNNPRTIEVLVKSGCSLTLCTRKNFRAIDLYINMIVKSNYIYDVKRLDTASSANSNSLYVLSIILLLLHNPIDLWYIDSSSSSGLESNILYLTFLHVDDIIAESILKVAVATPKKHWNVNLMRFIAIRLIAKKRLKMFESVYRLFEKEILDESNNSYELDDYSRFYCPREVKSAGIKLLYIATFVNSIDIVTYLLNRGVLKIFFSNRQLVSGSMIVTNVTTNTVHAVNSDVTILLQLALLRGNNRLLMLLINEAKEYIIPFTQNAVSDVHSLLVNGYGNIIDINNSNNYIRYLSPVTLASLLINREMLKTVISNVPSKALAASFLTCDFNPISACVLTSNLEGLHILHSYIGSAAFARACYTITSDGRQTPFHFLFFLLCRHLRSYITCEKGRRTRKYKNALNDDKLSMIKFTDRSLRDIFEFLSLVSIKSENQMNLSSTTESKRAKSDFIVEYDDTDFWLKKISHFHEKLSQIDVQLQDNIVRLNVYTSNSSKNVPESTGNMSALYSLEAAKENLLSSFDRWSLLESRVKDFKFILGVRMIASKDVIDIKCNKLACCILTIFEYSSKALSANILRMNAQTPSVTAAAAAKPSSDSPIHWSSLKVLICGLAGSRMSSKLSAERAKKFSNNLLQYSFPFTFDDLSVSESSGRGGSTVSREKFITVVKTILDSDDDFATDIIGKIRSFFDESYFVSIVKKGIKKCTIKKCTILSDYLIDSLKTLFLWLKTIVDDCIIKYGLSSDMLSHDYSNNEHVLQEDRKVVLVRMNIVNLLNVRSKYEFVVAQIVKLVQYQAHLDTGTNTSSNTLLHVLLNNFSGSRLSNIDACYQSLHTMIKDAINSGIVTTDPITTSIGVTATNAQNSNNRDSMICCTLQLGAENQEQIGGNRRKYKNDDIGGLCDDMACLLIGRRHTLKSFKYEAGSGSLRFKKHTCPLLLLCYHNLWRAATDLLRAFIYDGCDVSSSLYLVTNTEYKHLLTDFHNIITAETSSDLESSAWENYNIHRTLVVTPLHFAIEKNQVDFISLFLENYTNYSITTELIEFAIYTGRNDIAILLLAKANYIKVSPLDAITSTFKNHVTSSPRRDTGNKKSVVILEFLRKILCDITDNLSVSFKADGSGANVVINSASDYNVTLSEISREHQFEPHFEGLLQGFFTSTKNSRPADYRVVLMDGSDVSLSDFRSNYSFCSRALPPPAVSAGFNNAGKNVLHQAIFSETETSSDVGFRLCCDLMDKGAWRVMAVDNNGYYPVYNAMLKADFSLANKMIKTLRLRCSTDGDDSSRASAINDVTSLHSIHTSLYLRPRLEQLLYAPALASLRNAEDAYADIFLRLDESAAAAASSSTKVHYTSDNDNPNSNTEAALALLAKAFVKLDDIVCGLQNADFTEYVDVLYSSTAGQLDSLVRSSHILATLGLGLGVGLTSGDSSSKENIDVNTNTEGHTGATVSSGTSDAKFLIKKYKLLLNSFRNISLSSLQEIVSLETAHKINSIVCGWFRVHNTTISKVRRVVKGAATVQINRTAAVDDSRKKAMNLFATRLDEFVSFSKRWDLDCVSVGLYGYENIITNSVVVDTIKHSPNNEIKLLTSQLLLENCINYNNLKYNYDDSSTNNATNLEIILKSLNYKISGLECALVLSYKLIEFGRWIAITRHLIAATNSGGGDGGLSSHPLESVRKILISCRNNEVLLRSIVSSSIAGSSDLNDPSKDNSLQIKMHGHDFGINFRLKMCDSLSVNQLSIFFTNKFKFAISTKFQSLKNIITKGIELVLNIIMLSSSDRSDAVEIVGIFDTINSSKHDDPVDEHRLLKLLIFLQNIKVSDAINVSSLKSRNQNAIFKTVTDYFEELLGIGDILKRVSSKGDSTSCNITFDDSDNVDIDAYIVSGTVFEHSSITPYVGVADKVAMLSGIDIDTVNNLLPPQLSSHYNKNIMKNRIKIDVCAAYEIMSILQWVVRGFAGLYRHRDIYAVDVRYKLNTAGRKDPLALIAAPTVLLHHMHRPGVLSNDVATSSSKQLNNDLWLKNNSEQYAERLLTLKHYFHMNISRSIDRNRLADELTLPILFSASFGGDELLRELLNLISTFEDISSTFAASANHDSSYIVWSVLMLFPSPVDASSLDANANQERPKESSFLSSQKRDKYQCFSCCLFLLLQRDFPVRNPPKTSHTCTALAALKKLPSELVLAIYQLDRNHISDVTTTLLLPLSAIAFSVLSKNEKDSFLDEVFSAKRSLLGEFSNGSEIFSLDYKSIVDIGSIKKDVNIFSNYMMANVDITNNNRVDHSSRIDIFNIIRRRACDTFVDSLLSYYSNVSAKRSCPLWLHINETAAKLYSFSLERAAIPTIDTVGEDSPSTIPTTTVESDSDDSRANASLQSNPHRYRSRAVSRLVLKGVAGSTLSSPQSMSLHSICLAVDNKQYFEMLVNICASRNAGASNNPSDFIHTLMLFCCYYCRSDSLRFVLNTFVSDISSIKEEVYRRAHFLPLNRETTAIEILFASKNINGLTTVLTLDSSIAADGCFADLFLKSVITGGLTQRDIIILLGFLKSTPDTYSEFIRTSIVDAAVAACQRGFSDLLRIFLSDFIDMSRDGNIAITNLVMKCLQTSIPLGHADVSRAIVSVVNEYSQTSEVIIGSFMFPKAVRAIKHAVRLFLIRRRRKTAR